MSRRIALLLSSFLVYSAIAAPLPSSKEVPFETGWEKPVDRDGDCKFVREKGSLTIELPAKNHDLSNERGRLNAPHLLRTIEGDFVAQVRVKAVSLPSADSTVDGEKAFVSAGLLIFADDRNFISLECLVEWDGESRTYAHLREARIERDVPRYEASSYNWTLGEKDGPAYLRLERKDDKLSVWISTVGEKWKDITTLETNLPSKVKVGVVACSASKGGYKPTFDKFMLFKKKEKNSRN